MQRENTTLKENLRLAKREIAEMKLEKEKEAYEKENGSQDDWGGY